MCQNALVVAFNAAIVINCTCQYLRQGRGEPWNEESTANHHSDLSTQRNPTLCHTPCPGPVPTWQPCGVRTPFCALSTINCQLDFLAVRRLNSLLLYYRSHCTTRFLHCKTERNGSLAILSLTTLTISIGPYLITCSSTLHP